MRELTGIRKNLSYALKIIVIVSAAVGTFLSVYAGRNSFMGGSRVFMYFTTQSNIAVAIICAVGCFMLMRGKETSDALYIVKFVGAVAITLTGVVFVAVLAPTMGTHAWNVQNTLTHVVVPIAAVADFFVISTRTGIKKKNVFYVVIPPLLYAIYAGIAYVCGWKFSGGYNYPYFFLNWGSPAGAFGFTNELPYMGCAWWIMLLLAFLIIVGYFYLAMADRLGKQISDR